MFTYSIKRVRKIRKFLAAELQRRLRLVTSRYLSVFWGERRLGIRLRRARGLMGREEGKMTNDIIEVSCCYGRLKAIKTLVCQSRQVLQFPLCQSKRLYWGGIRKKQENTVHLFTNHINDGQFVAYDSL